MSQTHTTAEVAKHKDDANGYWLIVENDVYDVTSEQIPTNESSLNHPSITFLQRSSARTPDMSEANPILSRAPVSKPRWTRANVLSCFFIDFLEEHPGGAKILKRFSGKNATKAFWKYHNESVLKKYGDKYKIGSVGESAKL